MQQKSWALWHQCWRPTRFRFPSTLWFDSQQTGLIMHGHLYWQFPMPVSDLCYPWSTKCHKSTVDGVPSTRGHRRPKNHNKLTSLLNRHFLKFRYEPQLDILGGKGAKRALVGSSDLHDLQDSKKKQKNRQGGRQWRALVRGWQLGLQHRASVGGQHGNLHSPD